MTEALPATQADVEGTKAGETQVIDIVKKVAKSPSIEEQVAKTGKIGVTIVTPFRWFPTKPEEQAEYLQDQAPQIGRALRELADHPFYTFEFLAAVGGICRARNGAIHDILKGTSTWTLNWDQDLRPEDPAAFVLRMLGHRKPIVAGMYCRRTKRPSWACTFLPVAEVQHEADGLLQVAEAAGGAKLIINKVYREIRRIFVTDVNPKAGGQSIEYIDTDTGEAVTGFYQQPVMDRRLFPEDYFLDYLCRCAQIPIFVDTKTKIRHHDADGTVFPEKWPAIPGVDTEALP